MGVFFVNKLSKAQRWRSRVLAPLGGAALPRAALAASRWCGRKRGRGGGGAAMKRDVRILLLGEGEGHGAGGGSPSPGTDRGARGSRGKRFSCRRGARAGVVQVGPPSLVGPGERPGPPVAPDPVGVIVTSRSVVSRLRSSLPPAAVPLELCRTGANVNVLPLFPSPGGEDVPDHGSGGRGVS